MKKLILIIMIVSSKLAFSATPVRSYREVIADKVKVEKLRVNELVNTQSGKPLSLNEYRLLADNLVTELNMTAERKNSLITVLMTTAKKQKFVDDLMNLVAISKAAVELKTINAPEATSLNDAAAAAVNYKTNMVFVGASPKAATLNQNQLTKVTAAMQKIDLVSVEMIPQFLKSERITYAQILNTYDKSVQMGSFATAEEAFVSAVMTVKKMTKEQAIDYLEKMKSCI